ncbi:MAG: sodium:proton antiporter [Deltaproteobacteria bacterium]|nr:sodium:proton antiporter [Deltaproteobacteria bacterium]
MPHEILISIVVVLFLGVGAEWIAWRFQLPSILLFLLFGILAGPTIGFLKTDELLGDLLHPLVSISVAIILFEGGLNLSLEKLKEIGSVFRNLMSIGAVITWIVGTLAACFILNFDLDLSILLGAILIVSGPTVIVPLMRHIHPKGKIGSILTWEGIAIDPIGALCAVLVFESIMAGGFENALTVVSLGIFKTIFFGVLIGVGVAYIIVWVLKHYLIPDFLNNTFSLMAVLVSFTVSNMLQAESGLLSVTLMGVVLANQKHVDVRHIVHFKENLRVLLISTLFILLAARLTREDLAYANMNTILFVLVLIFVARPLAVFFSTIGSELQFKEKLFLGLVAPRGIVAAAVSSVFALKLAALDYPQAEHLVPITFFVIIGTVAFYGLCSSWFAKVLGVRAESLEGVMIIGAHTFAREIAKALKKENCKTVLIDNNLSHIITARMEGLSAEYTNVLSEDFLSDVDLEGIGKLMALTSNDEVNTLSALHFEDVFGPADIYQLPPERLPQESKEKIKTHFRGRILFGNKISYSYLSGRFEKGAQLKTTKLTDDFNFAAFNKMYPDAVPLFVVSENGRLFILSTTGSAEPRSGQILISVVNTL